MADDRAGDIEGLQYEMGGVLMALLALIKSHPDPMAFATELRLMAGDLQLDAAALGRGGMPPKTRQLLQMLLDEAEAGQAPT